MLAKDIRLLIIGAHPDDADIHAGCTAMRFAQAGAKVRMVSLTNGNKGHQTMSPDDLAKRRYLETQNAVRAFGIDSYIVCNTPDCELEPTVERRKEVTRIIREFSPHVILTHRLCDYHADHRATSQLVLDSAYLLGVPNWCPESPVPSVVPAIFYMRDGFMDSNPFRPDVVIPCDDLMRPLAKALACHESQIFEWLPFDAKVLDRVPPADDTEARLRFIESFWAGPRRRDSARRFREKLLSALGKEAGEAVTYVEPLELCEYSAKPNTEAMRKLFPFVQEGLVTSIF